MVRENGLLADALLEHNPHDPDFGPPYRWPCRWDDITVGLGAPLTPDEVIPDPAPTPDQLPGEEQPLEGPDPDDTGEYSPDPDRMGEAERELSHDFEPDPDEIADYLERLHFEEGCNARFV